MECGVPNTGPREFSKIHEIEMSAIDTVDFRIFQFGYTNK